MKQPKSKEEFISFVDSLINLKEDSPYYFFNISGNTIYNSKEVISDIFNQNIDISFISPIPKGIQIDYMINGFFFEIEIKEQKVIKIKFDKEHHLLDVSEFDTFSDKIIFS